MDAIEALATFNSLMDGPCPSEREIQALIFWIEREHQKRTMRSGCGGVVIGFSSLWRGPPARRPGAGAGV